MPAAPETFNASEAEPLTLTGPQKLAALLVILGADSAAQVLKHLDDAEIDMVTGEMTKITAISPELQQQILREFGQTVVEATNTVRGGAEFAEAALQKGFGAPRASTILNRVAPARRPHPAIQRLAELEADQIMNVLKTERPQTVALVTSCLPPARASQVLALLPPDLRERVVERVATLGPAPVESIEKIVSVLLGRVSPNDQKVLSQTGGLKTAATVLKSMDKKVSQSLLTSLEERNPELGQAIRQKMFTFEDMVRLDATVLQRILREVDLRDLALALKPVGDHLKNVLLGCISKRAAETVKEEISFLGATKMRDIEAAQLRIVGILRRLENEGEIDLGDSKEETKPAGA